MVKSGSINSTIESLEVNGLKIIKPPMSNVLLSSRQQRHCFEERFLFRRRFLISASELIEASEYLDKCLTSSRLILILFAIGIW